MTDEDDADATESQTSEQSSTRRRALLGASVSALAVGITGCLFGNDSNQVVTRSETLRPTQKPARTTTTTEQPEKETTTTDTENPVPTSSNANYSKAEDITLYYRLGISGKKWYKQDSVRAVENNWDKIGGKILEYSDKNAENIEQLLEQDTLDQDLEAAVFGAAGDLLEMGEIDSYEITPAMGWIFRDKFGFDQDQVDFTQALLFNGSEIPITYIKRNDENGEQKIDVLDNIGSTSKDYPVENYILFDDQKPSSGRENLIYNGHTANPNQISTLNIEAGINAAKTEESIEELRANEKGNRNQRNWLDTAFTGHTGNPGRSSSIYAFENLAAAYAVTHHWLPDSAEVEMPDEYEEQISMPVEERQKVMDEATIEMSELHYSEDTDVYRDGVKAVFDIEDSGELVYDIRPERNTIGDWEDPLLN